MSKINLLFRNSPYGTVLTSSWLAKFGISRRLVLHYVQSSWLEKISDGAYKKAGENVSWLGGVSAIQHQLELPIHVGAKTALQLLGRAHFIPIHGIKVIYLFMPPKVNKPKWLGSKAFPENIFRVNRTSLFVIETNLANSLGIVKQKFEGVEVYLSAPERAMLEVLYLVPTKQTFEEAFLLMEGLVDLRPDVVQSLLENCRSIKVKRLFLYMAEKSNSPWFSELNLEKIDLGSGKRKIGKGGVFDSKYMISVPQLDVEIQNSV